MTCQVDYFLTVVQLGSDSPRMNPWTTGCCVYSNRAACASTGVSSSYYREDFGLVLEHKRVSVKTDEIQWRYSQASASGDAEPWIEGGMHSTTVYYELAHLQTGVSAGAPGASSWGILVTALLIS